MEEMIISNQTNPFSEKQLQVLQVIILTAGSISLLLSIFVVLTLAAFKEKRKFPAWFLNAAFSFSVGMIELFLVIGAGLGFDSFGEQGNPSAFCKIQGIFFVFFGSCMVWFWFFITVNLFLRMVYNRDFSHLALVGAGFVLSALMTIPPAIVEHGIDSATAWCFINGDNWQLLYFDYYAIMGICSVIGLVLWIAIMFKLYQSGRILSKFISPLKSTEDEHIQAGVNEKRQLFFRQLVFVTVFEVTFIVFVATRIQATVQEVEEFYSWLFHTIVMSTLGIYVFAIFGLKRQNFELWIALFRKGETHLGSFASRAEYERI